MKTNSQVKELQLSTEEIGLLCYAMGMAPRQLKLAVKKITQEYSLGPRGPWILGLIAAGPRFPLDLTQVLGVGRSLITAELTRLTEAGLISTRKNSDDGRRTELTLTPLGEEVHAVMTKEVSALVLARIAPYTREEILLCTRILEDICGSEPEEA